MRTSSKFLISIVIILLASACSSEKKQQKAIVKQPSLEKAIIGSWTTEGSAEQIDDYMMAGYGQQIIFNNDKTFEMGVMMSISGTMPYETAALPVSATFGAEISGKYAIAGNTVTLTYSADSITGHMDPDDIAIDFSQYPDITDIDAVRQALVTHLEPARRHPQQRERLIHKRKREQRPPLNDARRLTNHLFPRLKRLLPQKDGARPSGCLQAQPEKQNVMQQKKLRQPHGSGVFYY